LSDIDWHLVVLCGSTNVFFDVVRGGNFVASQRNQNGNKLDSTLNITPCMQWPFKMGQGNIQHKQHYKNTKCHTFFAFCILLLGMIQNVRTVGI
jgi:hypothetical protein